MNAFSVHQPYAWWLVAGYKLIETRTHDRFKCLVGQRVAQEVLEDIIDGAKSEAKYIEKQIKLLQEGTEAKIESAPLFIAEAGDYSLTQVVNYGPSLLNLGNEHVNWAGY